MANFWSGFNQGFQPYGTRAADLISRTILDNKQYERVQKDKQSAEQQKMFRESLLNKQYDQIENEVKGGDFTNFTKLPSERRVAINQKLGHLAKNEPKKLYQKENHPTKGNIWYEVTVPNEGEPTFRELSVTPTALRSETKTVGNKKIKRVYNTDGTYIDKDITEIDPKEEKLPTNRRDLFYHPKSDTRDFQDTYREKIRSFNQKKANVKAIEAENEGFEEFGTNPAFVKAKNALELEKIKLYSSQLELVADDGLAKVLDGMYDNTDETGWSNFYNGVYDKYLEGGISEEESKTLWVLDTLYEIQFNKKSPLNK